MLNRFFQRTVATLCGRVFLDAAAGIPESRASRRARRAAERVSGNPSSPHAEGRAARALLDRARLLVARTYGVRAGDVIFCSGGTEAVNLGVLGVARALAAEGRPVTIAVAASSHPAARRAAEAARDEGASLVEISIDARGRVDPTAVAAVVGDGLTLVVAPRVAGETGAVSDTRGIGDAARRAAAAAGGRAVLLVDAAQAALVEDVSPSRLGADLVAIDGAKVGGPSGSGCLLARVEVLPVQVGGRQEGGRRAGTENVPAAAALAAALAAAKMNAPAAAEKTSTAAAALWSAIGAALPEARRNVAAPDSAPHFLSVCLPGVDGAYACAVLDERGVAASPSAACRAAVGETLAAGYPDPRCASSSVRFSFPPAASPATARRVAAALVHAVRLAALPAAGRVVE